MTQIDSSDLRDVGKTRPVLENITNKWSILILTFIALYEWALEHGAEMERAQEVYDSSRVKEI